MKNKKTIINHEHKAEGLNLLASDMEGLVQKLLGSKGLIQTDILRNWQKIVGENLAHCTLPQKLDFKKDKRDEGTLFLIVSSGALALEVSQKTPIIIEKINTYFGYKAVNHIKIIQQEVFFEDKIVNVADMQKKKLVTEQEQNYISQISQGVEHEELKARLQSLGESILRSLKEEE